MRDSALATGLRGTDVDAATLSPGVERSLLDAAMKPAPAGWRWRLLYVGRVVAEKDVDTAIRSLTELPPEATLRVVGDGDARYLADLERLAGRLGVAERVTLERALPRDRLPALYREANAVLFTVRWAEPWGLVPLEAMALAGRWSPPAGADRASTSATATTRCCSTPSGPMPWPDACRGWPPMTGCGRTCVSAGGRPPPPMARRTSAAWLRLRSWRPPGRPRRLGSPVTSVRAASVPG